MADHAVVLGGSLAGLTAARALSERFEQVTVLERDSYAEGDAHRPGVPQSKHGHVLLARGRLELARMFPGFVARAHAQGARDLDFGIDFASRTPLGWGPREATGDIALLASRALLERVVKEELAARSNVTVRERTEATAIGCEGGRVRSVVARSRDGGSSRELEVDLVVDATGRSSRGLALLEAAGVAPPEATIVDPRASYASRWYRAPRDHRLPSGRWWRGAIFRPTPLDPRMALLIPIEGDRWIVSLAYYAGRPLPGDAASFERALGELPSPLVAEAVAHAEPLSPVYAHAGTANRFVHFERWRGPAGFVAVGDAACAFNPVHGQGLSVAATSGALLAAAAARVDPRSERFARHFFRVQARWHAQPWSLATGADFAFPETLGARPRGAHLVAPYMRALAMATADDRRVRHAFSRVLHLLAAPGSLFAPAVALRVAVHALRSAAPSPGAIVPALPPVADG